MPVYRDGMLPHPTNDVADRISELGRAPDIAIWTPLNSESGEWEAVARGWRITEGDPATFADRVCRRLGPASTEK